MAFWGTVHGVFLLAGAVSTCLAFAAGLMYLAQSGGSSTSGRRGSG